jgi:hypothetical protein
MTIRPFLIAVTATAILASTGETSQAPFKDADHYPAGQIAPGDFVEDGYPEFVAIEAPDQIATWRNDGAGQFSRTGSFSAGGTLLGIAVGDVDGDGHQDVLALTAASSTSLVIFRGAGDGSFTRGSEIALSGTKVFSADLNRDGRPDAIVTGASDGSFAVLLNQAGTLHIAGTYATPGISHAVTAADFDGDGAVDIAVLWNYVTLFHGRGDGTFTGGAEYDKPGEAIGAADMDGDGFPDLALAETGYTRILWNDGTGNFSSDQVLALLQSNDEPSLAIADLDGDGRQDLAVTWDFALYHREAAIWFGAGHRTFDRLDYALADGIATAAGITALDTRKRGTPDLLMGYATYDGAHRDLAVLQHNIGRSFAGIAVHHWDEGSTWVTPVDFRRSGKQDLLAGQNGRAMLFRSRPDGTFDSPEDFGTGGPMRAFDLNRDGRSDIVEQLGGDTLSIRLCGSDGRLGAPFFYSAGEPIGLGDFNGDGWPDLMTRRVDNTLAVSLNDATGHFGPASSTGMVFDGRSRAIAAAGDLDGDGFDDIAMTPNNHGPGAPGPDTLWLLRNDRNGAFSAEAALPADCGYHCPSSPQGVFITDLDRDGRPDAVVMRAQNTGGPGSYDPYYHHSNWTFDKGASFSLWAEGGIARSSDIDGDGAPDFVAVTNNETSDGRIQLQLNHGDGSFGTAVVFEVENYLGDIAVGDFNGDSRPDVVVGFRGLYRGGGFAVLLNQSPSLPTAVLLSLISARVEHGVVTIAWSATDATTRSATVYRKTTDGAWTERSTITGGDGARFVLVDADVQPGSSYAYRLDVGGISSAEVRVNIPPLGFALESVSPNPSRGSVVAAFTLAPGTGVVELLDITGRRVDAKHVTGAQRYTLALGAERALAPGLYFVRIQQGKESASASVVVLK